MPREPGAAPSEGVLSASVSISIAGFDSVQDGRDVRRFELVRADRNPADSPPSPNYKRRSSGDVIGIDAQRLINAIGASYLSCLIEKHIESIAMSGDVALALEQAVDLLSADK